MKIDPKHDYKKPLYALGVATLIGATALFGTACGPKDSTGRTKSNRDSKPSESEVELGGDMAVVETDPTDVELAGDETICETEPSLGGIATVVEPGNSKIEH
ncbi:MAG: hypothetical protein K5881_02370 [Saccharofermentans sp.]|nr:hypothetical protein [Saccharofermentans sp.]